MENPITVSGMSMDTVTGVCMGSVDPWMVMDGHENSNYMYTASMDTVTEK